MRAAVELFLSVWHMPMVRLLWLDYSGLVTVEYDGGERLDAFTCLNVEPRGSARGEYMKFIDLNSRLTFVACRVKLLSHP